MFFIILLKKIDSYFVLYVYNLAVINMNTLNNGKYVIITYYCLKKKIVIYKNFLISLGIKLLIVN